MKSRPAASASLASWRQSGQLADQRSGTLVAERPDEQLAPNSPILSALPLCMAILLFREAAGANIAFLPVLPLLWLVLWRRSLAFGGPRAQRLNQIHTSGMATSR